MSGKGSSPRKGRYDRPIDGAPKKLGGFWDNRTPQEKYEDGWDALFGREESVTSLRACPHCHTAVEQHSIVGVIPRRHEEHECIAALERTVEDLCDAGEALREQLRYQDPSRDVIEQAEATVRRARGIA